MDYKKIVFTQPREACLVADSIDESSIPSGSFLLKNYYSLVSAGTERACYQGIETWFRLPNTPGYACVGEVIGKAGDVTDLEVGDLVFCQGKHAEVQIYSTKQNYCKLPKGIDLAKATVARLFAIAFTAVRVSSIELGDDVLVVGQGIIGNGAAQLAQLQGANVVVMDLSADRLAMSAACGIRHTICSANNDHIMDAIKSAFDGRMPMFVIDATGVPAVIDQAIDYCAPGGQMILLGSPRSDRQGNITHFQQKIHRFGSRVSVVGAHEQMSPAKTMPYVKHSCERNQRICLELINEGRLVTDGLITNIVKAEEAALVYAEIDKNNPEYLGVVFDWR